MLISYYNAACKFNFKYSRSYLHIQIIHASITVGETSLSYLVLKKTITFLHFWVAVGFFLDYRYSQQAVEKIFLILQKTRL